MPELSPGDPREDARGTQPNMKRIILLILAVPFAFTVDGQQKVQPTAMFSDMRLHRDTGDLLGTEIFITYGGGLQYWAQFQEAEGHQHRHSS
jgi:hypothetical protein